MSTAPEIAGRAPLRVPVEAGKAYYWCACGKSAAQPFCDGSHAGSSFVPLAYTAVKDGDAYFCTCKHTATPPLCDGSHKTV